MQQFADIGFVSGMKDAGVMIMSFLVAEVQDLSEKKRLRCSIQFTFYSAPI